jgi:hypothetical protein
MQEYLQSAILESRPGLVYVERSVDSRTRHGLMLSLDLEQYDFNQGSTSLIRATEGTIVERLPPRMKIRRGAALELPHILVLIDDPQSTVLEPLAAEKSRLTRLYDFDLMLGSGHLSGFAVPQAWEGHVMAALRALARPEAFSARYGVAADTPVLLFAMGDGNHSLATAKAVWEQEKPHLRPDHPARYALVEIENVHDAGLEFEPIHRLIFGLKKPLLPALLDFFGAARCIPVPSAEMMQRRVDEQRGDHQLIGLVSGTPGSTFGVLEIDHPGSNLPVGTLQSFLDAFLKTGGADRIDYVHGAQVVCSLGAQPGNAGFYVPGMEKPDLFKTVILDGALPRKTFSMGEAHEKRFYMEARKIV